jgi:hypothetical protein
VESVAVDFLRVLNAGSCSTNLWLRILHETALRMDWLLRRVLAKAAWPPIKYGITRAITWNEHQQIMTKERNEERKRYYDALWHTGGAPVDIANLTDANIDWDTRLQMVDGVCEPRFVSVRCTAYLRLGNRPLPKDSSSDSSPRAKRRRLGFQPCLT